MNKCRNCGRYPFCVDIEGPNGSCNKWIGLEVKCKTCLGCNRLEDHEFKGIHRCDWYGNGLKNDFNNKGV